MNDENNLPFKGPTIDLNEVAALNQRRSVTFMNNFLVNTSNFLNNFSVIAEENIAKQTREMQKLEIAINILESKLDSIPGLDDAVLQSKATSVDAENAQNSNAASVSQPQESLKVPEVENILFVKDDPRYAKFLKMISIGIPQSALESKMRAEGLDPNLLTTPDAPVPDPPYSDDSENEGSLSSKDGFSN